MKIIKRDIRAIVTTSNQSPQERVIKVLVVEDELLIGMDLAMQLEDWGYVVVGPHRSSKAAIEEVRASSPDIAILDVNLGNGETSMPIANHLRERNIPFVFLTGYHSTRLNEKENCESVPLLRKPVEQRQLRNALDDIVSNIRINDS